ncbi:MAG: response regulator [Desulfomonilaceae bacterium]
MQNITNDFFTNCRIGLLLDLVMPKMDGTQRLKDLVAIDPSGKVVVASGQLLNDSTKETNTPGAKAWIRKPYDVHEALGITRRVIDHP